MKKLIFSLIILIFLIFIYGYYIATNGFILKENNINISSITDSYNGFKIVQFSDTLISSSQDINNLNNIVSYINKLEPDVIVFTGDLIKSNYKIDDTKKISDILKNLNANLDKYAIIGDNDQNNLSTYKSIMDDSSFKILDNESSLIFYKDINPIQIIGLTTPSSINNALVIDEDITPVCKILLTHYPDNIDSIIDNNIDVVISGHSLHGQIRLPFFGGMLKKNGATKYIDNYYEVGNTKLYVSGGLGTEKIHFRLLNKPEINLYRLEK